MEIPRSNEYAATIVNSMVTGTERDLRQRRRIRGSSPACPRARASRSPASSMEPVCDRPRSRVSRSPRSAEPHVRNVVELTVRAVLESRPDHVRHAVMLDPRAGATLTLDEIYALCDELTRAHGDLIPQAYAGGATGRRNHYDTPRGVREDQLVSGISLKRSPRSTRTASRRSTTSRSRSRKGSSASSSARPGAASRRCFV